MERFLAELKRRHIYRVAAGYTVLAWLLLQVVNNVVPLLQTPLWVGQSFLLLLLLGFPLTLFLAWTRELPPLEAFAPHEATVTDWVLISVCGAVLVTFLYQLPAVQPATPTQIVPVDAARLAAASPATAVSIAVLPFENLSGDPAQEFFSDGMTEEITAALAKVPDLRVVARTSAFQFRAQNRDIQSIGQQLHATHFIEGSVRKAGNRVRITAQLIKSDDGTHVWAENYDRQLTDIFAMQEDIARAITTSLRMPLGLKPGENLVNNRAIDAQFYEEYLRGKALVLNRGAGAQKAIGILEPLVAKYPDFAPAWVQLAAAYNFTMRSSRLLAPSQRKTAYQAAFKKAEEAARHGLALDASLADAYFVQSILAYSRAQMIESEELNSKALALDPDNADALNQKANFLAMIGNPTESLVVRRKLQQLEPFVPVYSGNLSDTLWLVGQNEEAIAVDLPLPGAASKLDIARKYASLGRFNDAAAAIAQIDNTGLTEMTSEAQRLLHAAPKKTAPKRNLDLGPFGFVYLYVGVPERALEDYESNVDSGFIAPIEISLLWHSSYASLRKTDRFKTLMRKAGLVEYWRAKGWPVFCHPTTGDDFACN